MVLQCPRCGKNDFKKTRDLTNHLNRKFKCKPSQIPNPVHPPNPNISRPQLPALNPSPVIHVCEKEGSKRGQATDLSIEDLANWLANPEIKNNPTIINKKIPKTDAEWFDLMEESSSKRQKKTKVSQPIKEDSEAGPGPTTQAYRKGQRKDQKKETLALEIIDQRDDSENDQRDDSEDDPKDLDKKVPWPVPFPDNKGHRKVWQKGIQTAKDMFKVDGAEYTFSTWFALIPKKDFTNILLTAKSEKEVAKKAKEIYLQWGLSNVENLSEKIESLIREYKAEDKGSPEWIAFIEEHFESGEMYEAGMTKERAKEILNAIDDDRFLIRVKFIRDKTVIGEGIEYAFQIIDKYEPIRESKRAGKKFVPGGSNVVLTKKTKPGFWVGIDNKFLVREVQIKSSDFDDLTANAVIYGLYRIREPDSKRLMPMKDGALNCIAQRVIEHFKKAKRGYGLTNIRKQKIGIWEKRMYQPGARVEDVAELEKILKRPIKLLDITHRTIFNSGKYRTGRFEEIEMVVHNGHAFPRNHHFPRDRMVEYYNDNAWNAINKALQGPEAIWLIGLGLGEGETLEEIQSISQFVLEDGRTFRTWMKHTDIIKACKELFEDVVDWQFREGIINEKRKQESLESLKIVELAEQVFGANHAGGKLANEINDWHPTPASMHENIKQSCVEHGHGGRWNAPNYQVENVVCIDMKECYPASMRGQGECLPWFKRFGHPTHYLVRVAVNGELPQDDITGFAQVRSFKFVPNIHSAIPVWYGKHFACRSGEGCGKTKGWTPIVLLRYLLEVGILESVTIGEAIISLTKQTKVWLPKNRDISCAIIGKFTQGNKVEEKRLTHRVVIDEGELDFLIQDCIKEGTYAGSDKCPLGHILTYYEGHQPQYTHLRASMLAYAHINLLEMLRRFGPNEVVRIATDSIYIRKEALYKIENVSAFFKQAKRSLNRRFQEGGADTSKFQCPHKIPSCAMCGAGVFYSKEAVKEFAKEVKVHYVNRITGYLSCNEHKPFVCAVCFGEWYFHSGSQKNTCSPITDRDELPQSSNKGAEEKIREIQPGQWRDKGEKIHGPDPNVVYWPKNRHWESIKNITDSTAPSIRDPITRSRVSYLNGGGGSGKTTRAIRIFKDINMVVFTHTNALAKDFQNDRKVKAQTWHSFFRWNGVGEWTPERMGEKKFPRVIIWDEVCTVPRHILEKFIDYLLEQKCQIICCGDDAQPPPFFGEMPHDWLKERADYYEEVLTDYRAKCPRLQELKKKMRRQNNRVQSDLFREALPVTEKWEYLEAEWKPSDRILSAHLLSRRIASQKCLELHRAKYPNVPIPLIYRPRDGRKQNCLVQIPGSSEKKELVKNDIIHLPLNTLPDKFLQDMLGKEKAIDWELGYAMTIHTSQGMTLKSPQRVWVIDENLAWDNLIYLAVGRVEYLSQLIRVEAPPLPPEIAQEIEEAKKRRRLEHELRPSIQEKLIGYMYQDKERGREFDLTVDYILKLKRIQEDKCALCLLEMKFEWDRPGDICQWTVDRTYNNLGHIKGNVRLTCLLCNRNHRV